MVYTVSEATTQEDFEAITNLINLAYSDTEKRALKQTWFDLAQTEWDAAQAAIAASQTPLSVWFAAKTDADNVVGAGVWGKEERNNRPTARRGSAVGYRQRLLRLNRCFWAGQRG